MVAIDGEQRCQTKNCTFAGICMDLDGDGVEECVCEFDICDETFLFRRRRAAQTKLLDEYGENDNHEPHGPGPICGSDGRLYASACYMDKESCIRQTAIYQEEISFCGSATMAPTQDPIRHRSLASTTITISGTGLCGRVHVRVE